MAFRIWFGSLVAGGLIGVVAAGCSSSNGASGSPADAGGDVVIRRVLDGGSPTGDDGGGDFDGTTGKACVSDADCISANGPGINVCSSGLVESNPFTGVTVEPFSSPVCLIPPTGANCDPAPLGETVVQQHFCDGPDDPSSPGVCLPFDSTDPQPGQGICFPKCTFTLDGAKPVGCAGSNVCSPLGYVVGPPVTGFGVCQSGCQSDADCALLGTGFSCETDIELCTQNKLARTKAVGDTCTVSPDGGADDSTTGACNCAAGASATSGVCTSLCITGGTPCPNGWICETGETAVPYQGATVTVTKINQGLPGVCYPPCSASDGGAATTVSDGGEDGGVTVSSDAAAGDAASLGDCAYGFTCMLATLAGPECTP